ncbi:MAG: anthranilate phosphoribosyltransferase [Planctomycetes bacterium]|nr:anthranilate phosphoribosyltransferase [Planctomycetota bacterium]
MNLQPFLSQLTEMGLPLSEEQAHEAFSIIMGGDAHDAQIGALLALVQQRGGPTVEELTGAARVMREHVTPVPVPDALKDKLIDTCGTGGAPKMFNVSTAAAIVAAGAGAVVAKHGNRSRTGRGSAEVLEALGVNVDAGPETQAACLDKAGVCFSFAVHHHPAMKHAMPARRALGFPTMFNLLGPLTNPAGARKQLLGVYAPDFTELLGRTLLNLGCERALVVHGRDGLDEITTTTTTQVTDVDDGVATTGSIDPTPCGFIQPSYEELAAITSRDTVEGAADLLREVLSGKTSLARDITVLNAAAALMVADVAADLQAGVQQATEALESGAARQVLDQLVTASHE